MNYSLVTLTEFQIIGIAVRTTNQNGKSQNDIGALWGKFMSENIFEKIPDKQSADIYCVYTDYESDFNGAYTTILGCKVNSLANIPEGFIGKNIPTTEYRLYISKGKIPDAVVVTWMHIWQSGVKRKYQADFDVYGPKSQDQENAEVSTYLSVV
jgi:predicted transcriptional regulator YdeE